MKKISIIFIIVMCLSCFGVIATTTFAQNDARNFTTTQVDAEQKFVTDYDLDGQKGFSIKFTINETGIPQGDDIIAKRLANSDYIVFDFADLSNNGFRVKIFPFFDDTTYSYNRMQADLYVVTNGIGEYLETIDTFEKVFEKEHTLSYVEYMNYRYISVDGVCFIPDGKISFTKSLSLDVAIKSSKIAKITLNGIGEATAPVSGEWSTLGQTDITKLKDGTVEFDLKDKRVNQYNGQLTVMRENVINLKGYDVTKPIVLEYSYDIYKAMGVWYGLCLGRSPFGDLTKTMINTDGTYKERISSNNMINSDGVMFQMGTSLVQSQVQNGIVNPYVSNQGINGYVGTENLDRVVIEIGEKSTKMSMNGTVIFESLTTKIKDFPDGKCYPYFHFIGSPSNPYKENKIIIRGINAPRVESENVRISKGALGMTSVVVDNYDDTNGEIEVYFDSALQNKIDATKYIYDIGNKSFNVYNSVFNDSELGANKLYLKNDGGITELRFTLVDPNVVVKEPVSVNGTVKAKQNDKDLKIEIDTYSADFSRFYGNGISKSDYSYVEENGKQYIVIYSSFISKMSLGNYTFKLQTVNVNGDVAEGTISVSVVKNTKKGCGSFDLCIAMQLLAAVSFIVVIKNKKK